MLENFKNLDSKIKWLFVLVFVLGMLLGFTADSCIRGNLRKGDKFNRKNNSSFNQKRMNQGSMQIQRQDDNRGFNDDIFIKEDLNIRPTDGQVNQVNQIGDSLPVNN
jgi:hypothetical protein